MTYEQEFLKDFSEWIDQQMVFQAKAYELAKNSTDPVAKDAIIRYESRLDAYKYIQGKFENYKEGKDFHFMSDLGVKKY